MPASPPKTTAPRQASSNAKLAQALRDTVFQVRQTVATTSTVTANQCDSQASGYTTTDPPSMRIPRVTTVESSQPRASGSSQPRASRKDRSWSPWAPVFPAEESTILWTTANAQPRWRAEEPESLQNMEASVLGT